MIYGAVHLEEALSKSQLNQQSNVQKRFGALRIFCNFLKKCWYIFEIGNFGLTLFDLQYILYKMLYLAEFGV